MDTHCVVVALTLALCCLCVEVESVSELQSDGVAVEVKEYINALLLARDEKYEQQLTELKTNMAIQKKSFESKINALQATIDRDKQSYTKEISALKAALSQYLKVETEVNTVDVPVSESQNSSAEEKLETPVEDKKITSSQELRKLQANKNTQENTNVASKPQSRVATRIAFYAYVSYDVSNLGHNQTIKFDYVVNNIGGGYNGFRGVFVAPVTGTYVFGTTLRTGDNRTYGFFVINGVVTAKLDAYNVSPKPQVSQTVVVNLQRGDNVAVQNFVYGGGFAGDGYSTFSGFLLYEGTPEAHE